MGSELEDLIDELEGWQAAYPLKMFPEPDLKQAAEVLKANGMTLDSISASNMRHVVSCIVPKVLPYLARSRTITKEQVEKAEMALRDAIYEKFGVLHTGGDCSAALAAARAFGLTVRSDDR